LFDFSAPIEDLVDRGVIEEKPYETVLMDVYLYPIQNDGELAYVVCVFIVKNLFQGKRDLTRAKEYIEAHWRDAFDKIAIAESINLSVRQLYYLFKEDAGTTPHDYYKKCKVGHIKEKLADKDLTITEAFAACGESSRGSFSRIFKETVGLSPSQYRASLKSA
jgi:transcriptional regulator GlxA family with amidase domain